MRHRILHITIIILAFCNLNSYAVNSIRDNAADKRLVDSLYGPDIWNTYFEKKTTNNVFSFLQLIDDSHYVIKWGVNNTTMCSADTFDLDGSESRLPKIIAKGNDFILMRQGCGNPCWIGYFLGLTDLNKYVVIHEYLAYDLINNLVAYVDSDSDSSIRILNITTGESELHKFRGCNSAFIGYCIASADFVDDRLIIRFVDADNNSHGKKISIKLKIKK